MQVVQTLRRSAHSSKIVLNAHYSIVSGANYQDALSESFSRLTPSQPILFTNVPIAQPELLSLDSLVEKHAEVMVSPMYLLQSSITFFELGDVQLDHKGPASPLLKTRTLGLLVRKQPYPGSLTTWSLCLQSNGQIFSGLSYQHHTCSLRC